MSRVLNVFYGADRLPYKDQERQVHYPMVGNSFAGASLVDEIRFYAKDLGTENNVFVGIAKRPDGQRGYQVLTYGYDTELNEPYWTFNVAGWFTEKVGNVFVSLNVYQGGVDIEVDEDSGLAIVSGTPIIQATGSVVLSINYAPVMDNGYGAVPTIDVQEALSLVGSKVNTDYLTANYYNKTDVDGKLLLKADLSYVNGFVKTLEVAMDSSTYVLTFTCKDGTGTTISTQSIDLPLESVVVSGEYDSDTQSIILTLQNGNTISIPVSDLVDGLVDTTTFETAIQGIEDELDTKANANEVYDRDYIDGKLDLKADKTTTTSLQNQINDLNYRLTLVEEAIIGVDTLTFTALSYSAIPNVSDNLYPIIQSGGLDTKEVKGNSFVHSQLVQNGNFENSSGWSTENINRSFADNKLTGTCNGDNKTYLSCYRHVPVITGHKYLGKITMKTSVATTSARIGILNSSYAQIVAVEENMDVSSKRTIGFILNCSATDNNAYVFYYAYGSFNTGDNIEFENAQLFNLTKDFGAGNEPATYDQAVSMYASKGIDITNYVAYTRGTLIDSKPVKLISKDSNGNVINEYPITTEVLRSAGSVQDSAVSKKVGTYTFTGNESVTVFSAENYIYFIGISGMSTETNAKVLSSIYSQDLTHGIGASQDDKSIITYSGRIYIKDSSCANADALKTKIAGSVINYELATPAEQTATLPSDIEIEKGGSLEVVYDNGYTTPADFVFDCAVYKPLE